MLSYHENADPAINLGREVWNPLKKCTKSDNLSYMWKRLLCTGEKRAPGFSSRMNSALQAQVVQNESFSTSMPSPVVLELRTRLHRTRSNKTTLNGTGYPITSLEMKESR